LNVCKAMTQRSIRSQVVKIWFRIPLIIKNITDLGYNTFFKKLTFFLLIFKMNLTSDL